MLKHNTGLLAFLFCSCKLIPMFALTTLPITIAYVLLLAFMAFSLERWF